MVAYLRRTGKQRCSLARALAPRSISSRASLALRRVEDGVRCGRRRLEEAEGNLLAVEGFEAGAASREDEANRFAAVGDVAQGRRGHGFTSARGRRRLTWIAMPPLLTASCQGRPPHISTSRTCRGARIRI